MILIIVTTNYYCGNESASAPPEPSCSDSPYVKIFELTQNGVNIELSFMMQFQNCSPGFARIYVIKLLDPPCTSYTATKNVNSNEDATISFSTSNFNTNCTGSNYDYKVVLTGDGLPSYLYEWEYFTWGNSTFTTLNASIKNYKCDFIPGTADSLLDSMRSVIVRTFNNPIYDSDLVNVDIDFYPGHPEYDIDPDFIFNDYYYYINYLSLLSDINYVIETTNDRDSVNYPYYLNIIRYNRLYNGESGRWDSSILGFAWNNKMRFYGVNEYWRNFAIVCKGNIDGNYWFPNINKQSVYSYVASHELLHQVGYIGDPSLRDEHPYYKHTEPFADRCVLYWPNVVNQYFQRYTGFWRICKRHIIMLRSNLRYGYNDDISQLQSDNYSNSHAGNISAPFSKDYLYDKENGLNFSLSLPKSKYKKYEPVIGYFELMNQSLDTIKFYSEFQESIGQMSIIAKNSNGIEYNNNFISTFGTRVFAYPLIILPPKDTLLISMRLNNWGTSNDFNNIRNNIFGLYQHYPVGNYTVKVKLDNLGLTTNEVKFEVSDLDSADMDYLSMYKEGEFEEILSKYPEHTFNEHLLAEQINLLKKYYKDESEKPTFNIVNSMYEEFLNKYPNSYYLFCLGFIKTLFNYYRKIGYSISSKINEMKLSYPNPALERFLNNKIALENEFFININNK